jgi:hypothetical protein
LEVIIGNDVQLKLHVKIACYTNPPNPGTVDSEIQFVKPSVTPEKKLVRPGQNA